MTRAEVGLVSLSAAMAASDPSAVTTATEHALVEGATPAAVYEALLQCYLFVGFPRAIEALFAAGPVLRRHGFDPPAADDPDITRWNASV